MTSRRERARHGGSIPQDASVLSTGTPRLGAGLLQQETSARSFWNRARGFHVARRNSPQLPMALRQLSAQSPCKGRRGVATRGCCQQVLDKKLGRENSQTGRGTGRCAVAPFLSASHAFLNRAAACRPSVRVCRVARSCPSAVLQPALRTDAG